MRYLILSQKTGRYYSTIYKRWVGLENAEDFSKEIAENYMEYLSKLFPGLQLKLVNKSEINEQ